MKLTAALCFLLAIGLPACSSPPASETIKVQERYAYCLGKCFDFDLTVDAAGKGEYRVRHPGESYWTVKKFMVEPNQYAAFSKRLSAVRPAGTITLKDSCGGKTRPGIVPLTIEWSGAKAPSHLETCWTPQMQSASTDALRALRFSVANGQVVSVKEAADPYFF